MMNLRKNDHLYVMFRSLDQYKREILMVGKRTPPFEPCETIAIADDVGWCSLDGKVKGKWLTAADVAIANGFEIVE